MKQVGCPLNTTLAGSYKGEILALRMPKIEFYCTTNVLRAIASNLQFVSTLVILAKSILDNK